MTIEELSEAVGLPVRTIRFYISEGLIPGPDGRGKAASYDDRHLLRLKLVRRLSEQRVPLAEIQAELAGLGLDEIRSLLEEQVKQDAALEAAAQEMSPKEYISALLDRAHSWERSKRDMTAVRKPRLREASPYLAHDDRRHDLPTVETGKDWRRWQLAPGIELHVSREAQHRYRGLVKRLLKEVEGFFGS